MSKGQAKLAALTAERGAASRIAREIGVLPDRVSEWAAGIVAPLTKNRVKLWRLYGIEIESWDEPVEVEKKKRSRRLAVA